MRVLRIVRRIERVRADVAEGARHADAVWPDQFGVVVVAGIGVVALRIPALLRRFVEIGIGEQPQPNDAARLTIDGSDRHGAAAGPHLCALERVGIGERIGRAVRVALIEP